MSTSTPRSVSVWFEYRTNGPFIESYYVHVSHNFHYILENTARRLDALFGVLDGRKFRVSTTRMSQTDVSVPSWLFCEGGLYEVFGTIPTELFFKEKK